MMNNTDNKYLVMRVVTGRFLLCASPTYVHNFPNTNMQLLTSQQAMHYVNLLRDAYPGNVYVVMSVNVESEEY